MKKTKKKYQGIQLSKRSTTDFNMISDAIPTLIKKGFYSELWQTPQFIQANQLSEHLVKSATLLKKHLPNHFHDSVRFTQTPNTWVLSVNDKNTATQLSSILSENYQSLQESSDLPQFLRLRRAYRHWEKSGGLLCDIVNFSSQAQIKTLCTVITGDLQNKVRVQYQPSVWQLNVPSAVVTTRLKPLLDELSLLLGKDMGFAPKLKLSVVPIEWEKSGFILTELVKERRKIPTEDEAEIFLAAFLKSSK